VKPLITSLISPVLTAIAFSGLLFDAVCQRAEAHEVPTNVVVQTIVKPNDDHVNLLVRVPLEAMRDINFPQTRAGYLVISEADSFLRDAAAIWIGQELALYQNDEPLFDWAIEAVHLSLPSDRSFESYDTAMLTVHSAPLEDDEDLHVDQAMLDMLIRYPIISADTEFSIEPSFARLGLQTTTIVRYLHPDGTDRIYRFAGDPGILRLDPHWYHAFSHFVVAGVDHILDGFDHLLFVICLLIPFRRIRPLIVIVTAFTVAHSITLGASALGMVPNFLWFPALIETLIAMSIVYMAFENIIGAQWQKRWIIAFAFGLVHGFGFSFALAEIMQFAGEHLVTSLLAFNIGVELGQLAVIVLAVPLISFLFRKIVPERVGTILLSALVAHSGWHWMSDRASQLSEYSFNWSMIGYAFSVSMIRWLMLLVVIATTLWIMTRIYRRFLGVTGNDTL